MSNQKHTPIQELERAYYDNIRHNQIGEFGGVSPEVAADLGYETHERALEIIHGIGSVATDNPAEVQSETAVETSATVERAVLGSRARKDVDTSEVTVPSVQQAPANPEGRSPAALRRQQEILAADLRDLAKRASSNSQRKR